MQRTLKRESKVLEIVKREAIKCSVSPVLGLSSGRRAPGGPVERSSWGAQRNAGFSACVPECTSQAGGPTSVLSRGRKPRGRWSEGGLAPLADVLQPLGHTVAWTEGERGFSPPDGHAEPQGSLGASRSLALPWRGDRLNSPVPLPGRGVTGTRRFPMRGPGRWRNGLNRPVLKHGPRSLTYVRVLW